MLSQIGRDEDWDAPSGRLPAQGQGPLTLSGTLARALRTATFGRSGRKSAPARVATPRPDLHARQVVVKVRVVQMGSSADFAWAGQLAREYALKAAKLHLSYLERDGVEPDGTPGVLYGPAGEVSRTDFEREIPGEKHQFRIVISPADADELDLNEYVRTYMQRVEADLGQKLRWAAVNHYDTDDTHVHVVVRGVDVDGAEVRMDREYISHGLRHRASELATQVLGPRPERSRREQLKREAELERYTSLDATLERRAVNGIVQPRSDRARDPHLEAALKKRLAALRRLGLAEKQQRGGWKISPQLRPELRNRRRQAEAMRAIASVLDVPGDKYRILDRDEPSSSRRAELERGVQGVVRWKGLDEQGQFCLVVETTGGLAYHLPISNRISRDVRVGQIVEMKRALDKDLEIERIATQASGKFELDQLPESKRAAYQARLEQLERMKLATREGTGWRLKEGFRDELASGKRQPYWQMVAPRAVQQRLDAQITYEGSVWLDRVDLPQLGHGAFGREVRSAVRKRYEFLRGLGLQPQGEPLRRELERRQRQRLATAIAERDRVTALRATAGFEGTARLHRESNGERFLEIRSGGHFVLRSAAHGDEALDGQRVRIHLADKGRVRIERLDREQGRER